VAYRIRTCPELTLGLFERSSTDKDWSVIAMIHGTRTSDACSTDAAMTIGSHEPDGETAALHTLCVHPDWRARGLGTMILKEYIKRMGNEQNVKRVALIAHDELVPFYAKYLPLLLFIN
jgi:GNAT superfamily N-acetyltransferase